MKKTFILFYFVIIVVTSNGAWLIKEKSGDKNIDILIAENKMKLENGTSGTVFDLEDERITFYNSEKKLFWDGNLEELSREMDKLTDYYIEKELEKIQPEYRELYKIILSEKMENEKKDRIKEKSKKISIVVKREGSQRKIAGLNSVKYEVYVDNIKNREIWLAEELNLTKDIDIDKMKKFLKKYYESTGSGNRVSFSEEVIGLWEKGIPMKTEKVINEGEEGQEEDNFENIKVDRIELKKEENSIFKDYKRVSLIEF